MVDITRWQGIGSPPEGGGVGPPCSDCGISQWIELGGGPAEDINHPNIDIAPGPNVDIVCDLERNPLPFHDNHATWVKAIHSLQHLSRDGAHHVLRESYRIMRPGGRIYIMIGNLKFICQRILEDGPYVGWVNCLFHEPGISPSFGHHKWAWTFESMKQDLEDIGFSKVKFCGYYNMWELQMEAFK